MKNNQKNPINLLSLYFLIIKIKSLPHFKWLKKNAKVISIGSKINLGLEYIECIICCTNDNDSEDILVQSYYGSQTYQKSTAHLTIKKVYKKQHPELFDIKDLATNVSAISLEMCC